MTTKIAIIALLLLTGLLRGQTNPRAIKVTGTYYQEKSDRFVRTLKIKRNGKIKRTFRNLTSGFKESDGGCWKIEGDTLIVTFDNKACFVKNATAKLLMSDSCLLDESRKCVYYKK